MPAALLGATSCGRCGSLDRDRDRCGRCGELWLPALTVDSARRDPGPLAGVVPAGIGARMVAHLIDLVVVAAPAAVGMWLLTGASDIRMRGWLWLAGAIVALLAQACLLPAVGRTVGRAFLGLRTVDALAGTPLGLRRWFRPGGRAMLTVSLRAGRDSWRVAPSTAEPGPAAPVDSALVDPAPVDPAPVETIHQSQPSTEPLAAFAAAADSGPSTGVAVMTETGDRHDIEHVLLVGRSPVDPTPGPGRAVLAWPDLSRRLAKTHLMLEWSGTVLWVTDLESLSGTSVASSDGTRMPLVAGVRFAAGIGSVIFCGGRHLTVVPGA